MFGGSPAGGFGGASAAQQQPDHEVQQGPADTISSVAFSPSGCQKTLAGCTSWDKTVRVWELQTQMNGGAVGAVQSQPLGMQTGQQPLLDMSISRDGRVFYAGCCKTGQMWSLASNQVQQVAAHDLPIKCIRYVEDGVQTPMLITGGWDRKVRFWDTRQPTPVREEDLGVPLVAMDTKTSPMAIFCTARKVIVYDLAGMRKHGEIEPYMYAKFPYRCVSAFHDKSAFAVGTVDGRASAQLVDASRRSKDYSFKAHMAQHTNNSKVFDAYQVNCISVHPNDRVYCTGGGDGLIKIWDCNTKNKTIEFPGKQVGDQKIPVTAGTFNAEGSLFGYALGNDYALGKDYYSPQFPKGFFIKAIQPAWVKQ